MRTFTFVSYVSPQSGELENAYGESRELSPNVITKSRVSYIVKSIGKYIITERS